MSLFKLILSVNNNTEQEQLSEIIIIKFNSNITKRKSQFRFLDINFQK